MDIESLVNGHGKKYSPYKGKLINNLSIGQLALFNISGNIKKVENLTRHILKARKIDKVKESYPKLKSIEECLGKKELYESCLDIIKEDMNKTNKKEYISKILNTYEFGLSSGIFHTLIRTYYAVDGFEKREGLVDEVARSLAYYITAYKEGDLFERKINGIYIMQEMRKLINNYKIRNILAKEDTLGQQIRALYNYENYIKLAFVIKGDADDKVRSLLGLLLPIFINTGDMLVFHCITAIQALIGLREYYEDFERALDILTSTIITHLLTIDNLDFAFKKGDSLEFSWKYIISLAAESTNVHNIEIANSCRELYKLYPMKQLKTAALKKIDII